MVVGSSDPFLPVATPNLSPLMLPSPTHPPVDKDAMEVIFVPPADGLYDGRFANNGWLQEMPQSLTKMLGQRGHDEPGDRESVGTCVTD